MDISIVPFLLGILLGGLVFFILGYLLRRIVAESKVKTAESKVKDILNIANKEAENKRKEAELEAKDLLFKTRSDFERETKDTRQELFKLEKRILQKEENIDRKVEVLDKKERDIQHRERGLQQKEIETDKKEKEYAALLIEERERLQSVSGLTAEEAKKLLLTRMETEVRQEASIMIKRIEDETKEVAENRARDIIGDAIQRCAADHSGDTTVSVVSLPNDGMKGRIIGREGRNIRA
ncbi:MAG: DUF3552 domain-containing protein, partial [Candidatus Omnitrophica bacterium]|nr:DUF3552 domain-containing protein [Candidatus Omnitrophota bacterium]